MVAMVESQGMALHPDCLAVVYQKVNIRDQLFFSMHVKRVTKRNTYTVIYKNDQSHLQYARVEKFVSVTTASSVSIHAAILRPLCVVCGLTAVHCPSEFQDLEMLLFEDFVTVQSEGLNLIAVPLQVIVSRCFDVSTSGISVVTALNNVLEVAL